MSSLWVGFSIWCLLVVLTILVVARIGKGKPVKPARKDIPIKFIPDDDDPYNGW